MHLEEKKFSLTSLITYSPFFPYSLPPPIVFITSWTTQCFSDQGFNILTSPNNNNTTFRCGSRSLGIYGDPDVGSLTLVSNCVTKKTDSKRLTFK